MAAYTSIDNPELYFQVKTYTGTGSALSLTLDGDEDMQPDLVWIKERGASDSAHNLTDSVRGAGKGLFSNTNAAEYDYGTGSDGSVRSFDSDGFTLGTATQVNPSSVTMVAWCWKESATAGFDIVAYEGTGSARTVSHSLSAVPHVMHIKNRENTGGGGTEGWLAYHKAIGATKAAGHLNSTGVPHDHTDYFNDTEPTSSVFTLGAGDNGNNSGEDNIAYLWTSIQGFSKFGSYTGNGNADGTFVYTGFRPALVIIKRTDSSSGANWLLLDSVRSDINVVNENLFGNLTDSESSTDRCDFLSNGFKLRQTGTTVNTSSGTYIYMAFAEAPFVNSNGVPCNAR